MLYSKEIMDKQGFSSNKLADARFLQANKIDELLTKGVEKIYPSKEALEKILRQGKKLRLYQGFDPSMSNLHLGNFVGLVKLRQFQDLGYEVIFLVGDFTGMIGDPTDKSSTRRRLSRSQVLKNAKNWKKQAGKILNFDGENPAKIMFNSAWSDKITFKDLIEITSNFTAQQLLERDMFQKRIKEGKPIFLHELLYPVAQAIDCVKMNVDLELGGSDQMFNMMAGRTLMKVILGKEKFVMTTKLLVDSTGAKVGKTAGNAIFLNRKPADIFGAIMSFPDEVISLGFELLTFRGMEEIKKIIQELSQPKTNPMDLKKELAFEIVKILAGENEAQKAKEEFELVFQKRALPTEIGVVNLARGFISGATVTDVLVESGLASSKSEAKRLITQGGTVVQDKTITNPNASFPQEDEVTIQVGKRRFIKIKTS